MVMAWEKSVAILLHIIKTTTMVVHIGLKRGIFHAIIRIGALGPVVVSGLNLMRIISAVPCSDYDPGLPVVLLYWMLVLRAVVLHLCSKVRVVFS
jgi:hypothetical protein